MKEKVTRAVTCSPFIVEQDIRFHVCYVPYEEERVHRERRVTDRLEHEVPLCQSSQRLVFCNRYSLVSGRYMERGGKSVLPCTISQK
jgi:hypothetical protein